MTGGLLGGLAVEAFLFAALGLVSLGIFRYRRWWRDAGDKVDKLANPAPNDYDRDFIESPRVVGLRPDCGCRWWRDGQAVFEPCTLHRPGREVSR